MARFWEDLCARLRLTGKVRVGLEGFNVTLCIPSTLALRLFVEACQAHWSFAGIKLHDEFTQRAFFKPSPACEHAFDEQLSIKIVKEIVPFGLRCQDLFATPITYLTPARFHQLLLQPPDDAVILDARNMYESRLGYFGSSRIVTLLPPIRRFSDLPTYLAARKQQLSKTSSVISYCTGGIRCEKAARLAAIELQCPVYTLQGGINAYLDWVNNQVVSGQMEIIDSLFVGRNLVFDSRGSIGLEDGSEGMPCAGCASPTFRLGKCKGTGCALILLECQSCAQESVWCCPSCKSVSNDADARGGRRKGNCQCEMDRARRVIDPTFEAAYLAL